AAASTPAGRPCVGGDGAVAGPDQPGLGVELAGGPGGDAHGGASRGARGAVADAGDDRPDRVRVESNPAVDGPRDAVARRRYASPLVCGGPAASRGGVPTSERASGDASPREGPGGPGRAPRGWKRARRRVRMAGEVARIHREWRRRHANADDL